MTEFESRIVKTAPVESGADEEWAVIPRYEGDYIVSSLGRVYSAKSGRLLSTYRDQHDYLRLRLSHKGKTRLESVACLMLEAFVGPRPEGMVIRHLNDVSSDARLVNLAWGTMAQNRADSVRNGRHFQANATHCSRGHALVTPNLRASVKREGRRGCLVCKLEQDRARYHGVEPDYARADQRYAELMGGQLPDRTPRKRLTGKNSALLARMERVRMSSEGVRP